MESLSVLPLGQLAQLPLDVGQVPEQERVEGDGNHGRRHELVADIGSQQLQFVAQANENERELPDLGL